MSSSFLVLHAVHPTPLRRSERFRWDVLIGWNNRHEVLFNTFLPSKGLELIQRHRQVGIAACLLFGFIEPTSKVSISDAPQTLRTGSSAVTQRLSSPLPAEEGAWHHPNLSQLIFITVLTFLITLQKEEEKKIFADGPRWPRQPACPRQIWPKDEKLG